MRVHLVSPSDHSFGTAVITPRWLFVLAAATPATAGDPILVDESLEQIVPDSIMPGNIVGISIHTGTLYVDMRVADWRGNVVRGSSTAAYMPPYFPKRPSFRSRRPAARQNLTWVGRYGCSQWLLRNRHSPQRDVGVRLLRAADA